MKRVAHIITRLTLGGAQETLFSYYKHLDKERYKVFCMTGIQEDFGAKEYIDTLKKDPCYIKIPSLQNKINLVKDIQSLLLIYRFLKRENIQIVHTHSSKAGILGRVAAKMAKVPCIVHTVHGWSFHQEVVIWKRAMYIVLERLTAFITDRFIVVTKMDMQKGIQHHIGDASKYSLIRSGIDFEKFHRTDQNVIDSMKQKYFGKKIIGTIGRISDQKNPIDFIKIAKLICKKRRDVHFIWVGDGELRSSMEEQIKIEGLKRDISILGIRRDIENILPVFDVFILTSLWEGLPRVITEAMYCKVPVVANRINGVEELIVNGENGFSVKPHDIETAADKIIKLLDHPNTRTQIIHKGYHSVYPEFDITRMIEKTEVEYERAKTNSL